MYGAVSSGWLVLNLPPLLTRKWWVSEEDLGALLGVEPGAPARLHLGDGVDGGGLGAELFGRRGVVGGRELEGGSLLGQRPFGLGAGGVRGLRSAGRAARRGAAGRAEDRVAGSF